MTREWLTLEEVAKLLAVPIGDLQRDAELGLIPTHRSPTVTLRQSAIMFRADFEQLVADGYGDRREE